MSSAQVRMSSASLSNTCRDAYHAASSYFHLPIDEEEDEDDFIPPSTRHISWDSSDTTLIDPDTPSSIPSFPSTTSKSGTSDPRETPPQAPSAKNKAVINEILTQDDCYAVLGISRSSRIDKLTLRRAYLARSKSCHPEYVHHT